MVTPRALSMNGRRPFFVTTSRPGFPTTPTTNKSVSFRSNKNWPTDPKETRKKKWHRIIYNMLEHDRSPPKRLLVRHYFISCFFAKFSTISSTWRKSKKAHKKHNVVKEEPTDEWMYYYYRLFVESFIPCREWVGGRERESKRKMPVVFWWLLLV